MSVAPVDLRAEYAELQRDVDQALAEVVASGKYVLGPRVRRFEHDWATHVGAQHCVGVANGLDALGMALRAVGVRRGDEVIVPSNTYIATWLAVTHCGATPVPVEPDPATFNIDPARIERALTSRTAAIVPVHLYGQPADLTPIIELARAARVRVVEDAAQAHGAAYRGIPIGAHGDAVCWSFYPTKNLGALGDAGAVTTDLGDVAERIRRLRNYGESAKNENAVCGFNSRLDEVQAALLSVKLRYLDAANERRRQIAAHYTAALPSAQALVLPAVPPWAHPVWHQYVVRSRNRDEVRMRLRDRGVDTLIHYPTPPHRQPAYRGLGLVDGSLPISELLHREVISLPINPHMSEDDVERVTSAVRLAVA
jgi:dTDP-4-amino-4,6-dideoxygalactose transaminase